MMGKNRKYTKVQFVSSFDYYDFEEMDGLERTLCIDEFYNEYLTLNKLTDARFADQQKRYRLMLITLINHYGH